MGHHRYCPRIDWLGDEVSNKGTVFVVAGGAIIAFVAYKEFADDLGLPKLPDIKGPDWDKIWDDLVPDVKNPFTGGKGGIFGPPSKKDFKEGAKAGSKAADRLGEKLGVKPTPTATDEEEYQGAADENKAKSGPFKGYLPTGYWSAYLNESETKKWLDTPAGKAWSKDVQKYLKGASKSGGKLTKKEVEATQGKVPLPKSAPTVSYKDARGVWYLRRGSHITEDKAKNKREKDKAGKKAVDKAKKQLEATRDEFGTGTSSLHGRIA